MKVWKPSESERISEMPMMPMLPAKEVRIVRAFFVMRLLSERENAVPVLMEMRFFFLPSSCASALRSAASSASA